MNQYHPPLRRATFYSVGMPLPLLAGVCSGVAVHLGWKAWHVRWIMIGLGILGVFPGAFLYLWLWMLVPQDGSLEAEVLDRQARQENPGQYPYSAYNPRLARANRPVAAAPPETERRRARKQASWQLGVAGVAFLAIAVIVATVRWRFSISWGLIISICIAVLGLAIVWIQAPKIAQNTNWRSDWRSLAIIFGGILIMVVGLIALMTQDMTRNVSSVSLSVGLGVMVLVLVALLPIWLRVNSELNASREQETREAERADIAAHLHDSVLQTLTLIRANAADPEKVSSLALKQERELRSWLYTGKKEPAVSTAQQLRELIEGVEGAYGKEISLVTVGDMIPGAAELAAIAAAGEAATNAVRHGQPPFLVYQEVGADCLDIYVKDSGEGFDIGQIPADRHGVRDSIMGRVSRVNGRVRIRTAKAARPEDRRPEGTEIHIHVPLTSAQSASARSAPAQATPVTSFVSSPIPNPAASFSTSPVAGFAAGSAASFSASSAGSQVTVNQAAASNQPAAPNDPRAQFAAPREFSEGRLS